MTENEKLQQSVDYVAKYGNIAEASKQLKIPRKTLSGRYNKAMDKGYIAGIKPLGPEQEIGLDSKLKGIVKEKRDLQNKYNELLKLLDEQKNQNSIIEEFNELSVNTHPDKIKIKSNTKDGESVAVAIVSDLHYAESVESDKVDFLNEYNTQIASNRFKKVFQNIVRLVEINRGGTKIDQCVLALLGDFINGYIHEEFIETNEKSPVEEIIDVYSLIISGIDLLVEHGKFEKILVPCCIGNHGRTTEKRKIITANENSYEYLLYNFLAKHYDKHDIVQFKLSRSYFNWVEIFDFPIRFHHGENIKYNGGILGIGLPIMKAINQWDQARMAYLDVIGHYHQRLSGKKYIVNGSIIGYNAYAQSIKASFEKPQQTLFLLNKKYGRTVEMPIFVE